MQQQLNIDQVLSDFIKKHRLPESFAQHAQQWFIPLAKQIELHHNSAKKPFFVGLNGCQGSGKSTLTDFLVTYLRSAYNLNVLQISLDDFYISQSDRMALAIKVHPLLKTRGVPGTHNTEAIFNVLNALTNQQMEVCIPQFDKSTDDPKPLEQWLNVEQKPDIVLFEGWCWGVRPQSPIQLNHAINNLESQEDELAVWRCYVNSRLKLDYMPLYDFMNFWVMLKAPSFNSVLGWRIEQEHKLRQSKAQPESLKGLMNDQQITRFIQHYQRLTEAGLEQLPKICDVVLELDEHRNITKMRTLDEA